MGRNDHDHETDDREDQWISKVETEGLHCFRCGVPPTYDEREIFLETGMCSPCEHRSSKDD